MVKKVRRESRRLSLISFYLKADDEFEKDDSTSWVLVFLYAIIIWMMMTIMMVIFLV